MQASGALDVPSFWAAGSIKPRTERVEGHGLPRWGVLKALNVAESSRSPLQNFSGGIIPIL